MAHLQSRIGPYLPTPLAVDGHPRLSGIMDSLNSTLAHGREVRLPPEFYEPQVREILNRINVDEWFRGYTQSREYRRLGAGALLGDFRDRMLAVARGKSPLKLALYGAHDTTVAAVLASLGAFDGLWPPFTSNIALELFQGPELPNNQNNPNAWGWRTWFGKDTEKLPTGYYVRLRYNDHPVVVRGCKPPGNHLEGDESFCTLVSLIWGVDIDIDIGTDTVGG